MKVLLVAHGFPPELVGGTEITVQTLAHGLLARGVEVVVVAGSLQHEQGFRTSLEEQSVAGRTLRVHRIHRADLFFDHWQKSAGARAALAFGEILRAERPDVVHVHHWIRLSRDLVHRAALLGIPSVVTLHDLWTSCLVTFRVKPDTGEFCHAKLAPSPCLACAAQVPPRTPWLSSEAQGTALLERSADLARELELARAVLAPTRAHAAAVLRYLGLTEERLNIAVVPNGRDLALTRVDPPPPPSATEPLRLGVWGQLYRLKGADLVLQAVRRLPDPARVEVHIAGGEPEPAFAAELRTLAQGLCVVFHGPYAADALDRHPASRVHVFVSGTRAHESYGLVLDEAVALGVPLVLPRAGAYAERLEEGRGALFYAPLDPADLARILQRLVEEPGLAAALRASLPPTHEFTTSVTAQVEAHLALYAAARAAGAPAARAVPLRERLWQASEDAWGAALARCSGEELGLG